MKESKSPMHDGVHNQRLVRDVLSGSFEEGAISLWSSEPHEGLAQFADFTAKTAPSSSGIYYPQCFFLLEFEYSGTLPIELTNWLTTK